MRMVPAKNRSGSQAWLMRAMGIALGFLAVEAGALAGPAERPSADPLALSRQIDAAIQSKLEAVGVPAAPRADDAEFLRRVSLDIAGVIPTPERAQAFLDSQDPDKRRLLIDELLASPGYVRQMTAIWTALLIPNTAASLRRSHEPMIVWLEEAFAANKPWDQVAAAVINAELAGGSFKQPAHGQALFYLTHESVDQITDRFSRVFLGMRLQCAQCHNHPFTDWKQDEYWSLAAFFKVGGLKLPASAKTAPASFPRDPQADSPPQPASRAALADWLTRPGNRYFARAMVNRTWRHFFGRGIVNPVDDMVETNEPSHPELLELLARQFTNNGFDLHYLVRAICNSQTYQRSSRPPHPQPISPEGSGEEARADTLFSHMAIKVLTPLQLKDSLAAAFHDPKVEKKGSRRFLGTDDDPDPTAYGAGIPQVLWQMNAERTNRLTSGLTPVCQRPPAEVIQRLFLATLTRRPSAAEAQHLLAYVQQQADPKRACLDILWALVNTTEFMANH